MMTDAERPFRVVLRGLPTPKNMLSGHMTVDEAQTRADKANADALTLGLQPDYEVAQKRTKG